MAPVVAGLYGAKIPMHLLDKYLPGSASIAPLLSGLLGFNLLDYIWNTFVLSIFNFFTCSISIPAEDALHDDVLLWLTANVIDKPGWVTDGARRLMAGKARARDHTLMAQLAESDQSHMETPLATRQLTSLVKYEPQTQSSATFYFDSKIFPIWARRQQIEVVKNASSARQMSGEGIVLTRLGWTTKPLKSFLERCTAVSPKYMGATTRFFMMGYTNRQGKLLGTTRPSRPLDTVDLDQEVKNQLVEDIKKYLAPASVKFYAQRGIPHRRGYLFHGPPGTGKTSMSLALAGHFNLDLYILNLAAFQGTDHTLEHYFVDVPPRCIILLEDIDSAGIERENIRQAANKPAQKMDNHGRMIDVDENGNPVRERVTLSGLLNAIDGIQSPEGRVMIMTTNDPEALDEALIRPGRIDMQVFFGPVSQRTAGQIFLRMFTKDVDNVANGKAVLSMEAQQSSRQSSKARGTFVSLVEDFRSPSAWFEIISWSMLGIGLSLGLKYLLFDFETLIYSWILASAVTIILHVIKSYATISRWVFGDRDGRKPPTPTAAGKTPTPPAVMASNEPLEGASNELKELREMAANFGSRIPEGRFTAAEVQGFLLMNMESPLTALERINPWVEGMIAAKNTGKNVISFRPTAGSGKLTSKQRADMLSRIQYEGAPEALSDEFLISLLARTNPTQPGNTSLPNVVFIKGSPTSALFPSDATGNKKLAAYFSYTPKGAATTEDERREQRATVEFFHQAGQGVESIKGDPRDIIRRYRMPGRNPTPFVTSSDADGSRRIDTYFSSESGADQSGAGNRGASQSRANRSGGTTMRRRRGIPLQVNRRDRR